MNVSKDSVFEQSREFMLTSLFPSVVPGSFEPCVTVDAKPDVGTIDFLLLVGHETEYLNWRVL